MTYIVCNLNFHKILNKIFFVRYVRKVKTYDTLNIGEKLVHHIVERIVGHEV